MFCTSLDLGHTFRGPLKGTRWTTSFFHRLRREIIKRTRKEKQPTRKTLHTATRSGQQASSSHHRRVASSGRPPLMPYTGGNGQIKADGIMGCTYVSTSMHTLTGILRLSTVAAAKLTKRSACVCVCVFFRGRSRKKDMNQQDER